jgi:hypothetical protein
VPQNESHTPNFPPRQPLASDRSVPRFPTPASDSPSAIPVPAIAKLSTGTYETSRPRPLPLRVNAEKSRSNIPTEQHSPTQALPHVIGPFSMPHAYESPRPAPTPSPKEVEESSFKDLSSTFEDESRCSSSSIGVTDSRRRSFFPIGKRERSRERKPTAVVGLGFHSSISESHLPRTDDGAGDKRSRRRSFSRFLAGLSVVGRRGNEAPPLPPSPSMFGPLSSSTQSAAPTKETPSLLKRLSRVASAPDLTFGGKRDKVFVVDKRAPPVPTAQGLDLSLPPLSPSLFVPLSPGVNSPYPLESTSPKPALADGRGNALGRTSTRDEPARALSIRGGYSPSLTSLPPRSSSRQSSVHPDEVARPRPSFARSASSVSSNRSNIAGSTSRASQKPTGLTVRVPFPHSVNSSPIVSPVESTFSRRSAGDNAHLTPSPVTANSTFTDDSREVECLGEVMSPLTPQQPQRQSQTMDDDLPDLSKTASSDSHVSRRESNDRQGIFDESSEWDGPDRVKSDEDLSEDADAADEADDESDSGDDDVPLAAQHPSALTAQRSFRESKRRTDKSTVQKTITDAVQVPARNPFNFQPDELSRKLIKIQQQRDASRDVPRHGTDFVQPRPHVGHSLLPQTDESVRRRGARPRANSSPRIAHVQQAREGRLDPRDYEDPLLRSPIAPFVHNSVLTYSEDESNETASGSRTVKKSTQRQSSSRPRSASIGAGVKRVLTGHGTSKKQSAPPLPAIDTSIASRHGEKARPSPLTAVSTSSAALKDRLYTIYVGGTGHFLLLDLLPATRVKSVIEQVRARGELRANDAHAGDWALHEVWLKLGIGKHVPINFSTGET